MVTLEQGAVFMDGNDSPAAFLEVRGIGLQVSAHAGLSSDLSKMLGTHLGVEADRVYINFSEVPAKSWGWNGSTF